jgi:hypothetical protein
MAVLALSGPVLGVIAVAVVGWLLARKPSAEEPPDPDDPNAPDEDGFIPADKYGYGYDYSWGDPFGDPDL